ncbi:MAG: hypothetical protein Q8R91_07290, partial [Candidatus Omnitrophota bacterium]|nr:hypothetical protein [Candidatus Omnitrophota bacterium]
MINYQGRLTDTSGKSITGTYTMTFRFYDASSGGAKQWEEQQTVTIAESDNGTFNVILGSVTALSSVDFNSPLWLSVQVADDTEMTPRQRLTSTGYALNTDKLDSLDASSFLRTDVDTATSGKLTITRSGTALLVKPTTDPAADMKFIDVQNAAGSSKFSVDLEGDVAVAGDLAVTGTVSGSASITGTKNTTWTVDSDNTSGTEPASGAGLVIEGGSGDVSLLWDATNDELDLNQSLNVTGNALLSAQGDLRFADSDSSNYVAFQGPATVAANVTWTLPSADGSANQVLTTDGSSTLAWSTAGSISGVGDITAVTAGTGMTGGGTSGDVTLTLSTPVSVANGGTGAATFTSNGVLYGAGTSALAVTAAGATGAVLHGNTGAAPSFSAVSLTADVTGTLPLANGGTNSASLTNCTSGQALTVTSGAVACTSTITASAASANAFDFTEFKDSMALDANTTIDLGGFDLILDDMSSTDVFQLQNAQASADTATFYVNDTATANAADLVISPSDGGVLIDTPGAADLDESGGSPALTNVDDAREALAIASSPTAAASDGVLKLGRKGSKWEYIWYNSSEDKFVLSASTRVESSSPAYLLFSPPTSSGSTPGSRYGIKFDPEATPKTLSFVEITNPTTSPVENTLFEMKAGGRMGMEFVNMVHNGSFEAFSAIEKFRDVGFATGTFQHGATAALAFEGGWDNFAPDEWEWVGGDVVQHSPFMMASVTASLTTDIVHGKSAVGLLDDVIDTPYVTPGDGKDAAIQQTLRDLKPSTTYAIGVKAMVTNATNSRAMVDVTGEDAAGQLTPVLQSAAAALSTTSTTYADLIGTFKTDATASDVTLYLICRQTGTAATTNDMCRFDTVQVLAGKSVPEFVPNPIVDSGDQTMYGLLRVARTTDSGGGGGGGILSVDRFVRTRGVEFFGEDPGFTGTAGGMGMVGPPEPYPFNPTGAVGTLRLTTSGIYTGSTPRDYKLKITTDSAGPGGDTYTWYYRDMNMMTGTGTMPDFTQGGTGTVTLNTEVALNMGVKIKFQSTTASGSPINAYDGKLNDEWFLYATGMAMNQAYNSFSPTATYTPGESRIYKDPYTNQLMFQDGTTTASLKDIVGAGIGTAARVDYPMFFPAATGGGTMSLSTSQGYTGTLSITFDVEICADGTGTGRDSIRMRNNLVDGGGAATDWDIPCTQIGLSPYTPFDGNPNMDGFQGMLTNYGFSITFGSSSGTYQDGKVGDKWQLAAYPGGGSSAIKSLSGAKGVVVSGTGDYRTVELTSNCLNGEILKWNGTTWACAADGGGGGGSGDVVSSNANTFTATTASPIKIKPGSAPTANTKLLDMQATGAGTTNFSIDAEGDVIANSLDLTVPLPNAELDYISTAGKVSGAALTLLVNIPAGAGTIPAANTPLGAAIDSTEISDGTIANADISDTAAIADTKLATISTAGKVADTALSATVTKLGATIESSEVTDGTLVAADLAASAVTKPKLSELAPSAQAAPDLTVAVAAGKVYVSGNALVDAAATTANFGNGGNCVYTPVASGKFLKALIALTSSNTLACTFGTEQTTTGAAESESLTYPTDKLPIAEVVLKTTGTTAGALANIEAAAGTNSYLYRDVRPFLNLSSSGVTSVAKSGSTALTGAVTFSSSGAITLTQSGQDIAISAPTAGGGDVLTTGTNTLTATTASPIKIKPSSAPAANTKLFDMQATGAGTTNFSVDTEGDVVANGLDLTVLLPDSELATISTAGKVDGAALTGFASIPSGAGVIPAANTPLGATIETGEIADGTIATADVADGAITWAKLNGTTNLTLDSAAADTARTLTITNAGADTATAGTPDFKLILKGGAGQGATTEVLDVQNSAAASLFAVEAGGNVGIGT